MHQGLYMFVHRGHGFDPFRPPCCRTTAGCGTFAFWSSRILLLIKKVHFDQRMGGKGVASFPRQGFPYSSDRCPETRGLSPRYVGGTALVESWGCLVVPWSAVPDIPVYSCHQSVRANSCFIGARLMYMSPGEPRSCGGYPSPRYSL